MENASKALIIAGAILLSILIIAIGMYIFTSAKSTITESVTSMSTQQIKAFNDQFEDFEGEQTGSEVKALIGLLVGNAHTYEDEVDKIPSFMVMDRTTVKDGKNLALHCTKPKNTSNISEYVNKIGQVRNAIEDKHTYWVVMVYGDKTGLVDTINLYYTRPPVVNSSN